MTLASIINTATNIIIVAVPVAGGIALVAFLWNLAQLVYNISDTEKHKQARQRIVWAVLAMFVLVTFPGIIYLMANTFFTSGGGGMAPSQNSSFAPSSGSFTPSSGGNQGNLFFQGGSPIISNPGTGRNFGPSDIAP